MGVEVRDCLIRNNETLGGEFSQEFGLVSIFGGGGIAGVAPFVLVNSQIVGNECAGEGGGGGVSVQSDLAGSEIVLASCFFAGNKALKDVIDGGGQGGGATMEGGVVMNCVFTGNMADFGDEEGSHITGGGLRGTADVYLSTFYGNAAPNGNGGGVAFVSSASSVTSCIAWANTDSDGSDWTQQIFSATGICPTYSTVQDWECGDCSGPGNCFESFHNICVDPRFVDPDGPGDVPGTIDDNLRVTNTSPSLDRGDDNDIPGDLGDVNDDGMYAGQELPWDLD